MEGVTLQIVRSARVDAIGQPQEPLAGVQFKRASVRCRLGERFVAVMAPGERRPALIRAPRERFGAAAVLHHEERVGARRFCSAPSICSVLCQAVERNRLVRRARGVQVTSRIDDQRLAVARELKRQRIVVRVRSQPADADVPATDDHEQFASAHDPVAAVRIGGVAPARQVGRARLCEEMQVAARIATVAAERQEAPVVGVSDLRREAVRSRVVGCEREHPLDLLPVAGRQGARRQRVSHLRGAQEHLRDQPVVRIDAS